MMADLAAFHFLRPWFLLLVIAALALVVLWPRLSDPFRRWKGIIPGHLLKHLLIPGSRMGQVRPVHVMGAVLALVGLAAAGPAWEREPLPFGQDRAPMMVALSLSPSMDAADIQPTRLERAKQKVKALMRLRAGASMGLAVYAGTAHLVLPPTDDADIMTMFLDALDTSLMPVAGDNPLAALKLADGLLARQPVPGAIVFFTDGFDAGQIDDFARAAKAGPAQVLMIAAGAQADSPLLAGDGTPRVDAGGRPLLGRFDLTDLEKAASAGDFPLERMSLDDSDMAWVQREANGYMQRAEERDGEIRWKEAGYFLTFPIALLALLWFRRGGALCWLPVALALALGAPQPASAAETRLIDAFATPDQQGRWLFEHGRYAEAAGRFEDAMWRGWAYYRAGNYSAALTAFAGLRSAEGFFMMGNCYARLKDYPHAVQAYDNALQARPAFPEAEANRKLVQSLIPPPEPDTPPQKEDISQAELKFDLKKGAGDKSEAESTRLRDMNAEMWLRNLQTTPAAFLRQKFAIEAQGGGDGAPAAGGQP